MDSVSPQMTGMMAVLEGCLKTQGGKQLRGKVIQNHSDMLMVSGLQSECVAERSDCYADHCCQVLRTFCQERR